MAGAKEKGLRRKDKQRKGVKENLWHSQETCRTNWGMFQTKLLSGVRWHRLEQLYASGLTCNRQSCPTA